MKNRPTPLARILSVVLLSLTAAYGLGQGGETVITGRVTAQEDGSAVANATVSIPDLNLSATTDASGRYTLTVPASSARGQSVELRVAAKGLQSRTTMTRARRRCTASVAGAGVKACTVGSTGGRWTPPTGLKSIRSASCL